MFCFHRLGYKNIIASDIDDLRTADIPVVFKGTDFVTAKLVCSDLHQIQEQMRNRPNNSLIDFELQQKMNEKNIRRNPLINEVQIDVAGKSISSGNIKRFAMKLLEEWEIFSVFLIRRLVNGKMVLPIRIFPCCRKSAAILEFQ